MSKQTFPSKLANSLADVDKMCPLYNDDSKEKLLIVDDNQNYDLKSTSTPSSQLGERKIVEANMALNETKEKVSPNKQLDSDNFENTFSFLNMKYVLFFIFVSLIMYFFVPKTFAFLFSYFSGLSFGVLLCVGVFFLANKLQFIKINYNISSHTGPAVQENTNNMQSLIVQTPFLKENKNFDGVYKGWMNELREIYEPDRYFLNKTRSVYVNLDGVMLRLQTTSTKVPKRAVCNESIGSVSFNELRIYDLTGDMIFY